MPNPFENEELYDKLNIAGILSPGVVSLSGLEHADTWDIAEADGSSGASMTAKGKKLAQFTATFSLADDLAGPANDFEVWAVFVEYLLLAKQAKPPKALDIYHPDLALLRVSSVVVESIGQLAHDGKGGATAQVKFIEYAPPKKAGGSPKGSSTKATEGNTLFTQKPSGSPAPAVDPDQDVLDAIAEETKISKAEGKGKPKMDQNGLLDP